MTITIQLEPDVEAKLRDFAAQSGWEAEQLVRQLVEAELPLLLSRPAAPPVWLSELRPREQGGVGDLFGRWPVDASEETDTELLGALKAMDKTTP